MPTILRILAQTAAIAATLCVPGIALAQSPTYAFPTGTPDDEAQIRHIIADNAKDNSDDQMAANEDWENAFGIRYNNLKVRDAFYNSVVKPLQKDATDNSTLEVKIRFIKPDVAVADEYWHIAGQIDQSTGKPGADRWGRSTDTFVKQANGRWLEVLERITDLRLPYYKHYDAVPAPAKVPAATLAMYAGRYEAAGKKPRTVSVNPDGTLNVQGSSQGPMTAIPESVTSFLVFFAKDDVAEYVKVEFAPDGGAFTLKEESGTPVATFTRVR